MPHARALEREQRDALLDAHGLDLRDALTAIGADMCAFEHRAVRRVDRNGDLLRFDRQDAARMQHLGPTARDFLGFVVVQ